MNLSAKTNRLVFMLMILMGLSMFIGSIAQLVGMLANPMATSAKDWLVIPIVGAAGFIILVGGRRALRQMLKLK